MNLIDQKCMPIAKGTPALSKDKAMKLHAELPGWTFSKNPDVISKEYKFKDFVEAMAFANKIVPVAEGESHHPDLYVSWGKVVVELSTHSVGGLSENDFILAAKIDALV